MEYDKIDMETVYCKRCNEFLGYVNSIHTVKNMYCEHCAKYAYKGDLIKEQIEKENKNNDI